MILFDEIIILVGGSAHLACSARLVELVGSGGTAGFGKLCRT